ncbi:hypothetical protein [Mycoplasmopsis pulmonis]|uniref:hypothetical protein n=1 Tax=Mycoplasmopsis pulmonis TaxID=2107 RepID=UPI002ACEF340|nr:hypothetical protein [Mycoplasmopsis pulmonis]MDZ7293424.1 hypothetical protein [Mycoplasmopsis pulmonis]
MENNYQYNKIKNSEFYNIEKIDNVHWRIHFSFDRQMYFEIYDRLGQPEDPNSDLVKLNVYKLLMKPLVEDIKDQYEFEDKFLIKMDTSTLELNEKEFKFFCDFFFIENQTLKILQNFPEKYKFEYFDDIKVSKTGFLRNTIALSKFSKARDFDKTPDKIKIPGSIIDIEVEFLNNGKVDSEKKEIKGFIVGLGSVHDDEFKIFKGKKVNDILTVPLRKTYYGWNGKNDDVHGDKKIQIKILKLRNIYIETSTKEIIKDEKIQKRFQSLENLNSFIERLTKYEQKIYSDFIFGYKLMDFVVKSDDYKIDQKIIDLLTKVNGDLFDRMQEDPSIKQRMVEEFARIKTKEEFVKTVVQKEIHKAKVESVAAPKFKFEQEIADVINTTEKNANTLKEFHNINLNDKMLSESIWMNWIVIFAFVNIYNPNLVSIMLKELVQFEIDK